MPATLPDLTDSQTLRQTMVDCQVRTFNVTDQRLISRLLAVPRERFLSDDVRHLAYSDIGFVTKAGAATRYVLPPLILARLIQGGRVVSTDRVLDIASGQGYSTAVLAGLAGQVVALEADSTASQDLGQRLAGFGLDHVKVVTGDLAAGAASEAPFDVILLNGAVEIRPESLFGQLADGGRLLTVMRDLDDPTGRAGKAVCFEKRDGVVGIRSLFDASAPVLPGFQTAPQFVF